MKKAKSIILVGLIVATIFSFKTTNENKYPPDHTYTVRLSLNQVITINNTLSGVQNMLSNSTLPANEVTQVNLKIDSIKAIILSQVNQQYARFQEEDKITDSLANLKAKKDSTHKK